jgi:hypothetical protein
MMAGERLLDMQEDGRAEGRTHVSSMLRHVTAWLFDPKLWYTSCDFQARRRGKELTCDMTG